MNKQAKFWSAEEVRQKLKQATKKKGVTLGFEALMNEGPAVYFVLPVGRNVREALSILHSFWFGVSNGDDRDAYQHNRLGVVERIEKTTGRMVSSVRPLAMFFGKGATVPHDCKASFLNHADRLGEPNSFSWWEVPAEHRDAAMTSQTVH